MDCPAQSVSILPTTSGGFTISVTDYGNHAQSFVNLGATTHLILGGEGAKNVSIGDLSHTFLQSISVGVSPQVPQSAGTGFSGNTAISYLRGNTVTVHGSSAPDSFLVQTGSDSGSRQHYAEVSGVGPLAIKVYGMSSDDSLTLDGGGGGDSFNLYEDPSYRFTTTVINAGASLAGTLFVNGRSLEAGGATLTDTELDFTTPFSQLFPSATTRVVLDGTIGNLTILGSDRGDYFNANRSQGFTALYGGVSSDSLEVAGNSHFILDGENGADAYIVHWGQFTNVAIADSGSFGIDSLEIDDRDNTASVSVSYEVTASQLTRIDHDVLTDGINSLPFSITKTISFVKMGAITLDTGHGTNSAPNQIDLLGMNGGTNLTVNTEDGINHVDVIATTAGTTTTINSGTGVDDIGISLISETLDVIAGGVIINGNSATVVTVDDSFPVAVSHQSPTALPAIN